MEIRPHQLPHRRIQNRQRPVGLVQGLVPNQKLALGDLPLAAVTTKVRAASLSPTMRTFGYDPETHHVIAMSDNVTANSICNSVAGK